MLSRRVVPNCPPSHVPMCGNESPAAVRQHGDGGTAGAREDVVAAVHRNVQVIVVAGRPPQQFVSRLGMERSLEDSQSSSSGSRRAGPVDAPTPSALG